MKSEQSRWTFKPNADCVARARSATAEFALMCGFYRQVAEDIRLAVGEACNNAVEHAGSAQEIVVECSYSDETLTVSVQDHGRGFAVPPSATLRDLWQTRGLGIFLMRALMDRVEFVQEPNDGIVVTLQKQKLRDATPLEAAPRTRRSQSRARG